MIVKYYGIGHPAIPEKNLPFINAVIHTFEKMGAEQLSEYLRFYEPGASVWLVPGTFDLDGNHVE